MKIQPPKPIGIAVDCVSLLRKDKRQKARVATPQQMCFSRRSALITMIALPIFGCQNNDANKVKSEDDVRREILDADFDAAMRRAGDMRRSGKSEMDLMLTSAFEPFVAKHSLQTFEKYVEQRFGLGKTPGGDGKMKAIEGFPLLKLDWRFYYRDRITFFIEYPKAKTKVEAEGFHVRVIYIPWLVP